MNSKLKIITVVTDKNEYGLVHFLKASATCFNLDLIILNTEPEYYYNHRCKDFLLHKYLSSTNSHKIIFFTDGYDTMFLSSEDEILSKYYKADKKIIFSAEINCWPDSSLANKYPEVSSPFKYLCSGGFIGKAAYIKEKIEEKLETKATQKYPFSNQVYWTEQFLRDQQNMALDTQCQIFTGMSSEIDLLFINLPKNEANFNEYLERKVNWFNENFSFKHNRIFNKITQTLPCHIHTNGPSKLIAKEIADSTIFKSK